MNWSENRYSDSILFSFFLPVCLFLLLYHLCCFSVIHLMSRKVPFPFFFPLSDSISFDTWCWALTSLKAECCVAIKVQLWGVELCSPSDICESIYCITVLLYSGFQVEVQAYWQSYCHCTELLLVYCSVCKGRNWKMFPFLCSKMMKSGELLIDNWTGCFCIFVALSDFGQMKRVLND